MLTHVHRCVGIGVGSIHQVDAGEIFVRRHDVDGVLSRDAHEVGKTSTRTHKDTLEPIILQLLNGDGLAHDAVGNEVYAHLLQILYLYINNTVGETELRDTIFQYTTNLMQCLEDMHLIAQLSHIAGETQS